MARQRPILIGCPQYRIFVQGSYDCADDGRYLLGPGAQFLLEHAHCQQYGGRCMQPLCVLHRHNNRGAGSWFPELIVPANQATAGDRTPAPATPHPAAGDANLDVLA